MRILFLCLTFYLLIFPAVAERRAFVVGVQHYDELTDLSKTIADADGYAEVFGDELGFEVTKLIDPTFSDFLIALSDFEASIQEDDEVVFVFSGHGWSDGARNFLAMRDAPSQSTEVVLERLTFDLNDYVIEKFLARDPQIVIAIVDACRDNPFDLGTKSVTKGLVPQQTIPGTLVAYAAGANQKALDRLEPNDPSPYSVFTRALLPKLKNSQKPLMVAFDEARSETYDLAAQISHTQRPAIYSDISLDFCFSVDCLRDSTASPSFVFWDEERVMGESRYGSSAQEQLSSIEERMSSKRLRDKQKIAQQIEAYRKTAETMAPDDRAVIGQNLMQQIDSQPVIDNIYARELSELKDLTLEPMRAALDQIYEEILTDYGARAILPINEAASVDKAVDVTEEIVKRLDQLLPEAQVSWSPNELPTQSD